jgi:hypothetical protein
VNWSDERYVRVYVRDTVEWLAWSWQAQALFLLLLRKVDRAGCVDLPGDAAKAARGLSRMVGMPEDVIAAALPELEESGAVTPGPRGLVIRNYVAAQEAVASNAERQRRYKERQAAITERHDSLPVCIEAHQEVTRTNANSRAVTPSLAVPSLAEPSQTKKQESVPNGEAPPVTRREPKPVSPEAAEVAEYLAAAITSHQPTAKTAPGLWARDIDAAIRLDKRTPAGLRAVIDHAHRSPHGLFWRANLRSGDKLREHYDRIETEMATAKARASPAVSRFAAPAFDMSSLPNFRALREP